MAKKNKPSHCNNYDNPTDLVVKCYLPYYQWYSAELKQPVWSSLVSTQWKLETPVLPQSEHPRPSNLYKVKSNKIMVIILITNTTAFLTSSDRKSFQLQPILDISNLSHSKRTMWGLKTPCFCTYTSLIIISIGVLTHKNTFTRICFLAHYNLLS